jgi:hypothetical protein
VGVPSKKHTLAAVPRSEKAKPPEYPICAKCESALIGWKGPFVHCVGATDVFRVLRHDPHHGHHFWNCPRCRRVVGCDECAGTKPENILCERCLTFVDGDVVRGRGLDPINVDLSRYRPRRLERVVFKSGIEASAGRDD